MRAQGADLAEETLLAGLPLPRDGRLTPDLAVAAAEAQGFAAALVARPRLSDLPADLLPAVLFLTGRDACLWLGPAPDGAARVIWPRHGPEETTVPMADLADAYAGHALLLRDLRGAPAPERAGERVEAVSRPSGHWLWAPIRAAAPDHLQVVLASAVINALALAVPLFTMNVYDRVFPNAALVTLWSLVAGVGIALALDAVLKMLRARVIDRVGRRVDLVVSAALFRHLADLRLEAQGRATGVLANMLKDYEQLRDFFSSQTIAALTDLCFAVLFILVIFWIGGPLALPPALAFGAVLLIGLVLLLPLRRAAAEARQTGSVKTSVAVEALGALETLKALGGQGRMQARWEREVTAAAVAQERSRGIATFATTATAFATQASSVGIVVMGVYLALEGRVTMGTVIAAMILSGRAMAPTAQLSGLFVRGSFAMATLRSLDTVMALPTDAPDARRGMNVRLDRGALALREVRLSYGDAPLPALDAVTLEIAAGARIGLIGPVGSGKTSLVRVLAGLYAPSEGMALIDDINMAQIAPAALRRAIQIVPQEPVLFSGTLAENIAFGLPRARDAEIVEAARIAGVDAVAAAHPDGYAMPIAERGANLSGGQRQMIALARALLPRPKVLLLDEPTSSLDTASERAFIERLRRAVASRPVTLIVATHRRGLLDLVDRLVLLDRGRIVRDGPRAEVMAALAPDPGRTG